MNYRMTPSFREFFAPIYDALKAGKTVDAYDKLKSIEESLERNVTLAIKIEKKGKKKK